jgi:transcriptional regulator with GAF, ATPase, and Fis domain
MSARLAWYEAFGRAPAKDLVDELRSAGIAVRPRPLGAPTGPGIVFFDQVTPEVAEFVSETSLGSVERLLGVALRMQALEDGSAWQLLALGASDLIAWDHSPHAVAEIAARLERWEAVDRLMESPVVRSNLLGGSRPWRAMLRQVVEVAHFTDASVLILGESGTGKELIARLIHTLDARHQKRDLVVLDCTTVAPELAGSEFFGHERGAFTGAAAPRDGAFALADGGTLFLDEIGDLPVPLQAQLLRAVQERTFKRVGGNVWHSTRFRLLCATQRPLPDEVAAGAFRADLYYRIGGVVVRVPPLRDRPDDIVLLFTHFVAKLSGREEELPELDQPVRQLLLQRRYPGNVRELQQLARRTACRHVGPGPITVGDIPDDERPNLNDATDWQGPSFDGAIRHALCRGMGLKEISRAAAASAIRLALGDADGNLQAAARRLGVTDRALQLRRAAGSHARIRVIPSEPRELLRRGSIPADTNGGR